MSIVFHGEGNEGFRGLEIWNWRPRRRTRKLPERFSFDGAQSAMSENSHFYDAKRSDGFVLVYMCVYVCVQKLVEGLFEVFQFETD